MGAACKDFCQIRTLRVQYAWEPAYLARQAGLTSDPGWLTADGIVRDWINYGNRPAARTADSLTGRKPMAFSAWVFDLLGAEPGDTLDDLFPGTGAVMAAWHKHMRGPPQMAFSELFA